MIYLNESEDVDSSKIILTGVNDYTNTKWGINFGLSFFLKVTTEMVYSDIRHRLITDISQIIKKNHIEMIMLNIAEEK